MTGAGTTQWSSRVRAASAVRRILCFLPLVALAACQTISARVGDEFSLDQMRADGKSMVLFHTSVHSTGRCTTITMVVAHPDGQGRWVRDQQVTVKGMFDFDPQPSQMILPPGEWGIVHLTCHRERQQHHYTSRVAQRGSIWDGSGAIYDQPFATFRVGEGEVVDIGSLAIVTGQGRDGSGNTRSVFVGVVRPIPEQALGNLARANPPLFNARILRPMTTPPLPPGVRVNGNPAG